jgi:hypothetical protein
MDCILYLFKASSFEILLGYLNSIEQRPSGQSDTMLSYTKSFPHIRNSEVNYRVHKSPPPVRILSQMNPIYTPNSISL